MKRYLVERELIQNNIQVIQKILLFLILLKL